MRLFPVRRLVVLAALPIVSLLGTAAPALADHAGTLISSPVGTAASTFAPGAIGDWKLLSSFPLGPGLARPLGVDATPFSRGDKRYVLASSVTLGFRVFDVTDPAAPKAVADYGSAVGCATAVPIALLDNPRDILAAASGWENDSTVNQLDVDGIIGEGGAGDVLGDGSLAVIGTDAGGRCHDGVQGGFELVDISDPAKPTLLWLTRQSGEAHNSTYDPFNDVLLTSTSDGRTPLIDILDLKGCRTKAQGGNGTCTIRETRYQFPTGLTANTSGGAADGCHDITADQGRWYCAGVGGTVVLDTTGLRGPDGQLTGTPLPCPTTKADVLTAGGRSIVSDCQLSTADFTAKTMTNANIKPIAVAHHPDGTNPSKGGYDVSHQAEPVRGSPGILMVDDENGGGLTGAGCPGGGVGFFDMRPETLAAAPKDKLGIPQMPLLAMADANGALMKNPDGSTRPAVFTIANYPAGQEANPSCTSHVFKQWGSENRAFIAWYFGGGHAFDWRLDLNRAVPAVRFTESAYESLVGGEGIQQSWTTIAYRAKAGADGKRTYYVMNTDLVRGMDFLSVTLPAPPTDVTAGPPPPAAPPPAGPQPNAGPRGPLAATGPSAGWGAAGLLMLGVAVALRRRRATQRLT